jgi:hypothetical protein
MVDGRTWFLGVLREIEGSQSDEQWLGERLEPRDEPGYHDREPNLKDDRRDPGSTDDI